MSQTLSGCLPLRRRGARWTSRMFWRQCLRSPERSQSAFGLGPGSPQKGSLQIEQLLKAEYAFALISSALCAVSQGRCGSGEALQRAQRRSLSLDTRGS